MKSILNKIDGNFYCAEITGNQFDRQATEFRVIEREPTDEELAAKYGVDPTNKKRIGWLRATGTGYDKIKDKERFSFTIKKADAWISEPGFCWLLRGDSYVVVDM